MREALPRGYFLIELEHPKTDFICGSPTEEPGKKTSEAGIKSQVTLFFEFRPAIGKRDSVCDGDSVDSPLTIFFH